MLLAKLHVDALTSQNTFGGLKRTLKTLPRNLESAFNDTMLRIRQQGEANAEPAHKAPMWVVGARRPLTILELQCAVALRMGAPYFDEDDQPAATIITKVCAGLLVVDTSRESADGLHNSKGGNGSVRLVSQYPVTRTSFPPDPKFRQNGAGIFRSC